MSLRIGIHPTVYGTFLVAAAAAFPLGTLGADAIQTYHVPKESAAPAPVAAPAQPTSSKPLSWTVPAGWRELEASGVRVGSFDIPGKNGGKAELAIMAFPGTVGGEMSNVNRWRQEVGLKPVDEKDIVSEKVQVGPETAKLYQLVGSENAVVVAWLMKNNTSWFFKMHGDKETVNGAKPALIEFLKSVRYQATPAKAAAASAGQNQNSGLPAGHPAIGSSGHGMASMPTVDASKIPIWKTPASWKEQPAPTMVIKSFVLGDEKSGTAVVNISSFPGDVGGLLANVNRWRGQLGLSSIAPADLPKETQTIAMAVGQATLVQIDGTSQGKAVRLVGVVVPREEETWFYKMLGDSKVVSSEKDNLVNLVKATIYP